MIFEAKKDNLFSIIFYGSFLLLGIVIILIINAGGIAENTFTFIFTMLVLFLIIWIWYVTDYKISNNLLSVRSGPFSKNIPVRTITKVEVGKTKWLGYKLGLSLNGLIIHYNDHDEVYITPENQDKFCKSLKMIHKKIVIEKK